MPHPHVLHRHDLECTEGMLEWLSETSASLGIVAGGRLVVLSAQQSLESRSELALDGIGAIAWSDDSLWTFDRWQLWRFVDALAGTPEAAGERFLLPQVARTIGLLGPADLVLTPTGPVMASSLFGCLAVPDDRLSFRAIWAPSWVTELKPEGRSGLSGAAARHGVIDVVTLESRSDEPATERDVTGSGLVLTTEGDEVLSGLTVPRHPRWWRDTLLVAEAGSGRLLAIDPAQQRAETVTEVPGVAGGLAVTESHAVVGFSAANRSGRADLAGGRVSVDTTAGDGVVVVDLERGVVVGEARFAGHAGPVLSIAVIPAARATSIAEPRGSLSQSRVVMAEPEPL